MANNIRFNAWSIANKKMYEVIGIYWLDNILQVKLLINKHNITPDELYDDFVLLQKTSSVDYFSRKPLFEGDIVKYYDDKSEDYFGGIIFNGRVKGIGNFRGGDIDIRGGDTDINSLFYKVGNIFEATFDDKYDKQVVEFIIENLRSKR